MHMDKRIAGLLGAVAAVGALSAAQASTTPNASDALKVNSYADLLEPIPNAASILQALDEQTPATSADAKVQLAQFYHHHHHHHHGFFGLGIVPSPYRYYHHHHHHHHNHWYYRRYYRPY
jgi:hypothetical protein